MSTEDHRRSSITANLNIAKERDLKNNPTDIHFRKPEVSDAPSIERLVRFSPPLMSIRIIAILSFALIFQTSVVACSTITSAVLSPHTFVLISKIPCLSGRLRYKKSIGGRHSQLNVAGPVEPFLSQSSALSGNDGQPVQPFIKGPFFFPGRIA